MRINMFALGAQGVGPEHPLAFNVLVDALAPGYASAIHQAIEQGHLENYRAYGSNVWVALSDLKDLAGPGSDTDDPEGGCFVPEYAVIQISYIPDPQTR